MILKDSFANAISVYYQKYTLETINQRLLKKLRKVADGIAKEIVESYDFKQEIVTRAGSDDDRIIITSILTKKGYNARHSKDKTV